MSEQTTQETPKATIPEGATWTTAGIAVVVYVIAFFVSQSASDYDAVPAGWMSVAGMVAIVSIIPAIILTGLRHLVPALRA